MTRRRIRVAEPRLDGNEAKYVNKCMEDTWISSRGEFVDRFESLLAEQCEAKHAVVTNNGTTALHLALVSCGVQAGDEVIMPTLTYVASANAIHYCGATPVFVDSEAKHLNVDVRKIERAITPRTKAILPVPLYGHPCDLDPIMDIADRHGLTVVEDSAEAIGARYHGQAVGSLAHCSTFSFFGNKLITTGEGGAIVTNDGKLADRMRFLRGQAVDPNKNYWHPEVGFNYRMTNIAAAIGVAQLENFAEHIERRKRVAGWYTERLADYQDLIYIPAVAEWAEHSYWMYTVLVQPSALVDRDALMGDLLTQGVETRPVFYPVHWLPPYQKYTGYFPVADDCSSRGVNLPTHGNLEEQDVDYVCTSLIEAVRRLRGTGTSQRKAA